MRINQGKSECLIENFVMSCRAIGYGTEEAMLSVAVQSTDCYLILGIYKPTNKNTPASTLYSHAGFTQITDTDGWALDKRKNIPQPPTWIDVKSN